MASARVAEILASIADDRGQDDSLAERLCQLCATELMITGAGLALMDADGPAGVVAATDGPAKQMEQLQYDLGEGPCIDASRSGRPVLQADLLATAEARWPAFGAGVLAAGIRAIFAFPLQVGAIRVGILDLYRDTPGLLSDDELTGALAFADAATLVLLHLQDRANQDETHVASQPPLPIEVLDSRAVVHQATGMISVQLAVSLAVALLRLRATAYSLGRPVSDLAADVVDGQMSFDDSETGYVTQPQSETWAQPEA